MTTQPAYKPGYFADILAKGSVAGILPGRDKKAREWFRNRGRRTNVEASKIIKESRNANRVRIEISTGRMYLFKYDPKTKDKLPYWDQYPLVFPIKKYPQHFLALNLHYAPPTYRAKIMDLLWEITNNKKYDQSTKIMLTYAMMQSLSKLRPLQPCLKMYLMDHVRSSIVEVYAPEWDFTIFLPLAKWQKNSAAKVYRDFKKKI